MKYSDREQWILNEGTWYGSGAMFIAIAITLFLKIPPEPNTWKWGIYLGVIFVAIGIYCNRKANAIK